MSVDTTKSQGPLHVERNGVGTKPIGTFQQNKARIIDAATKANDGKLPDDFNAREIYRKEKQANIAQRKLEGQHTSVLGDFMNSGTGIGLMNAASLVTDIGTSLIDRDTTKNPTGFNTQQKIGDVMMKSGNPYVMAAGLAYKALSGVAEATGGNINTITKNQANELGLSKFDRGLNNILGYIPGLG